MCPSTTTGFGSVLLIQPAGPRKPRGGCFSNRPPEKPRPQETHDPKPGLTFLFPPVLTEHRENAVGRATDSNGNQDFYRLCHFCLHLIKSSQSSGVCVCCHKAMNASEYASSPVPFPKSGSFFIHSVNLFINLR